MKKHFYYLLMLLPLLLSCESLVGVEAPENQLTTDEVFTDTNTLKAAIANTYAQFDKTIDGAYNKFMGIYADELSLTGSNVDQQEFYSGRVSPTNPLVLNIWRRYYFVIYQANQIIEELETNTKIPLGITKTSIAEAKFLRAYALYYLVNTFGAIPLVLTTNVDQNAAAPKSDTIVIYQQIVKDLTEAGTELSERYIGAGKVRANKWAAAALLSRVYLHTGKWAEAELLAGEIIGSGLYTPLAAPGTVFLGGSKECILQFWTQNGFITDGSVIIPTATSLPAYPVTDNLFTAFEITDIRKTAWLKSNTVNGVVHHYAYKYHNRSSNTAAPEYLMALRAAEQYLIRAEARWQQKDYEGAIADINVIRQRAGLSALPLDLDEVACKNALTKEWRAEFFVEWGHRFIDLKRSGLLDAVMAYKSKWTTYSGLLPIPQNEITYNRNLIQNNDY